MQLSTYEVDAEFSRNTGIPVGVRFTFCDKCARDAEMMRVGPAAGKCEMCGKSSPLN